MFYGLTHIEEVFYGRFMNKFVALAPCIEVSRDKPEDFDSGNGEYRNKLGINV